MKALETTWRGYRFRSRTEARWAVALTAAATTDRPKCSTVLCERLVMIAHRSTITQAEGI